MIATIEQPVTVQPVGKCRKCGQQFTIANTAALALYVAGKLDCMDCLRPKARTWSRETYGDYLQTELWAVRLKRALNKALFACQVCKDTERLEVHHNTYKRIGSELDSDLIVLCRGCHELFHARMGGLAY